MHSGRWVAIFSHVLGPKIVYLKSTSNCHCFLVCCDERWWDGCSPGRQFAQIKTKTSLWDLLLLPRAQDMLWSDKLMFLKLCKLRAFSSKFTPCIQLFTNLVKHLVMCLASIKSQKLSIQVNLWLLQVFLWLYEFLGTFVIFCSF